ncbi:MAG: hypothetical protein H7211_06465 [Aquabacterium sp.]|nr:hypothetical protein [Ferruginibacter sp.]
MTYFKLLAAAILLLCFLVVTPCRAQKIILPNAYAHNDFWHKRPLLDALQNGFRYIEVDIFLRKEKLIVAHAFTFLKKKRTLEELYFKPLVNYINENNKAGNGLNNYPITLMIDIKTDASKTYLELAAILNKYQTILTGYENGRLTLRNVTIVLTGHKPYQLIRAKDSSYAFIDEDLKQTGKDSTSNIYPIASCKYSKLIKWKGKGELPFLQKERLEHFVVQAHKFGRKVRLWASPENKTVWHELLQCNVDLINTDRLVQLKNFLIEDVHPVAKLK